MRTFVTRAGLKLDHAMAVFEIEATGKTCADLGSNAGGFVDCLLQRGAAKVYAIDTGYGVLEWKLRKDARVVVMERTNAMHATLPEKVDLITIDVAWTKQSHILPAARRLLAPGGAVVTLIKPHYEAAPDKLRRGVLPESEVDGVVKATIDQIRLASFECLQIIRSPITGAGGNIEVLAMLKLAEST